jgi:hypothetical protein
VRSATDECTGSVPKGRDFDNPRRQPGACTSSFAHGNPDFPAFDANYIKNQREHHKQTDFVSEYRRLLEEQGIRIDERF